MATARNREERSERNGSKGAGARLAAVGDQNKFGGGVEADIVSVAADIGPSTFGPSAGIEGPAGAVAATADEKAMVFGEEKEALGFVDACQRMNAAAFGEVYDLNRVILEGRDEELARGEVNAQVVEASFDTFEQDCADEGERSGLLGGGSGEASPGQKQGQAGKRLKVSAKLFRHGRRIAAERDAVVTPKGGVTMA